MPLPMFYGAAMMPPAVYILLDDAAMMPPLIPLTRCRFRFDDTLPAAVWPMLLSP